MRYARSLTTPTLAAVAIARIVRELTQNLHHWSEASLLGVVRALRAAADELEASL